MVEEECSVVMDEEEEEQWEAVVVEKVESVRLSHSFSGIVFAYTVPSFV